MQHAAQKSSVQIPLKITLVCITLKNQGCLGCRFLGLTSRAIAPLSTERLYGTLCSALTTGTAAVSPCGGVAGCSQPQHKGDSDSLIVLVLSNTS